MMTEQEVRTIKIVKRRGEGTVEIETSVSTWGELKELFPEFEINFNSENTKAIDGDTRLEYTEDIARVGSRIYFIPRETKAGANRQEAYSIIQSHIEDHGDEAKEYYNTPTHYTRTKTDELIDRVENSPYSSKTGRDFAFIDFDERLSDLEEAVNQIMEYFEKEAGYASEEENNEVDPDLEDYWEVVDKIIK